MIINFASTILEIKLFITSSTCYYKIFQILLQENYTLPPSDFPFSFPCLAFSFSRIYFPISSSTILRKQWAETSDVIRLRTNQSADGRPIRVRAQVAHFFSCCVEEEKIVFFLCYSRIIKKTRTAMSNDSKFTKKKYQNTRITHCELIDFMRKNPKNHWTVY